MINLNLKPLKKKMYGRVNNVQITCKAKQNTHLM